MRKFNITYIKTKTIITDETTLTIEAEDANTAVSKGYDQLFVNDDTDWDLDTCKEVQE